MKLVTSQLCRAFVLNEFQRRFHVKTNQRWPKESFELILWIKTVVSLVLLLLSSALSRDVSIELFYCWFLKVTGILGRGTENKLPHQSYNSCINEKFYYTNVFHKIKILDSHIYNIFKSTWYRELVNIYNIKIRLTRSILCD